MCSFLNINKFSIRTREFLLKKWVISCFFESVPKTNVSWNSLCFMEIKSPVLEQNSRFLSSNTGLCSLLEGIYSQGIILKFVFKAQALMGSLLTRSSSSYLSPHSLQEKNAVGFKDPTMRPCPIWGHLILVSCLWGPKGFLLYLKEERPEFFRPFNFLPSIASLRYSHISMSLRQECLTEGLTKTFNKKINLFFYLTL